VSVASPTGIAAQAGDAPAHTDVLDEPALLFPSFDNKENKS
jgi:hypothetical protein